MKTRTVLIVAFQIVLVLAGASAFIGGLFAYDPRLGVAGVGAAVALAGLFIDDGTTP